jgi:phospholipase/carboxylesterase
LDAATDALGAFVAELTAEGALPEQWVLAGFSQGAIVATNFVLQQLGVPKGLLLISGMTVCEGDWSARMPQVQSLPILQIHSPTDPVVPYVLGKRLAAHFDSAGAILTFCDAPPGHYIHISAVEQIRSWLEGVFAD